MDTPQTQLRWTRIEVPIPGDKLALLAQVPQVPELGSLLVKEPAQFSLDFRLED
jgi:hypothetical protein